MSYINVVMPLTSFIPFIQEILDKNNNKLFIEKRNSDKTICKIIVNSINDIQSNRGVNLNFFIVNSESINENEGFYDDNVSHFVIEGTGGRVNEKNVERISLRLISKTPDKAIKKTFNAIKSKLKKDETIGIGVKGGSALHRNYFYQKSLVESKIFITDIYNKKSSVIEIL